MSQINSEETAAEYQRLMENERTYILYGPPRCRYEFKDESIQMHFDFYDELTTFPPVFLMHPCSIEFDASVLINHIGYSKKAFSHSMEASMAKCLTEDQRTLFAARDEFYRKYLGMQSREIDKDQNNYNESNDSDVANDSNDFDDSNDNQTQRNTANATPERENETSSEDEGS